MKIDDLNKCFDFIKPSDMSKEKMLYNILSSRNKVKVKCLTFKRCCVALAAVISLTGIVYAYTKFNSGSNLMASVTDNTENKSTSDMSSDNVNDKLESDASKNNDTTSESVTTSEKSSDTTTKKEINSPNSSKKEKTRNVINREGTNKEDTNADSDKSLDKSIIVAQGNIEENNPSIIARSMPKSETTEDYSPDAMDINSGDSVPYSGGIGEGISLSSVPEAFSDDTGENADTDKKQNEDDKSENNNADLNDEQESNTTDESTDGLNDEQENDTADESK